MSDVEELQDLTREMDTATFLRFLIAERYAGRIMASCSLRARSLVLLKLISDIDKSTPIVFCHAPDPLPESLEYRAELVSQLGLRDIRDPFEDEGEPLPGDCNHSEGLWAENPVDHSRAYRIVNLNRSLAGVDCWISGVYHGPYTDTPSPRITEHGRLVRIDPLASWSRDDVRRFMAENGLRYHPRSPLRPREQARDESGVQTYHF